MVVVEGSKMAALGDAECIESHLDCAAVLKKSFSCLVTLLLPPSVPPLIFHIIDQTHEIPTLHQSFPFLLRHARHATCHLRNMMQD